LRMRLRVGTGTAPIRPHPFPSVTPKHPLAHSTQELKRMAQEDESGHDLRKLGIEPGAA